MKGRGWSFRSSEVAVAALLFSAVPSPAGIAERWIEVRGESFEVDRPISLALVQGPPFQGRRLAMQQESSTSLYRLWRSGRQNLLRAVGGDGLARFRPGASGVQLIAYASEEAGRYAKALLVVGRADYADPIRFSELGHRLEIIPQTDPVVRLQRPGPFEVQVLFEREPLAGVSVEAVVEGDTRTSTRRATTDEIGLATVRLDRPGRWILIVERREAPSRDAPTRDSGARATLTLDVGPR